MPEKGSTIKSFSLKQKFTIAFMTLKTLTMEEPKPLLLAT